MSRVKLRRSITFRPVPKVWRALDLGRKYSIIYGGTRAGKTYTILQYIVYHAFQKSFNTASIVSATFPHLRKGAMQDFLEIVQPFYHLLQHNRTEHVFEFPTGAKVRFFSADEEKKLRGIKQDWCFINEVNTIDESRFFQLLMRTKRIIVDFNPVARFWLDDFIEKQSEDDTVIVKVTYKDNPHLSVDEVKSVESLRHNATFWKIYGLGERGDVSGRAFTNFEVVDASKYADLLATGRPIIGVDVGFMSSFTAVVAVFKLDDYEILAHELMYRQGAAFEELVSLLRSISHSAVIVDSANKDVIRLLRNENIPAVPSYKTELKTSYLLLNKYHTLITDTSKNLIKEAQNLVFDEKLRLVGADHALDALRYAFHKIHFQWT